MAGTKIGGHRSKEALLAADPNFYKRIGAMGGKLGRTGGFAAGEEGRKRARKYGAIGGAKSKRLPSSYKKHKV